MPASIPPPPAVRPRWPGKKIDLRKFSAPAADLAASRSCCANAIRRGISTTSNPITLAELARFLDTTARVLSEWKSRADFGDGGPDVTYSTRPYPSAGSAYELELYLTVANCDGLARGLYHYDAERPRAGRDRAPPPSNSRRILAAAEFAMDAPVRRRS